MKHTPQSNPNVKKVLARLAAVSNPGRIYIREAIKEIEAILSPPKSTANISLYFYKTQKAAAKRTATRLVNNVVMQQKNK